MFAGSRIVIRIWFRTGFAATLHRGNALTAVAPDDTPFNIVSFIVPELSLGYLVRVEVPRSFGMPVEGTGRSGLLEISKIR